MNSQNDFNTSLGAFLRNFSTPILTIISFIASIYGFVKLFADKDAGLITLVALIVGILLLFSICLYYARFWKPEQQDRKRSAFDPSLSDSQVKAQLKKEQRRKLIRRLAIAGLILIPLLSVSGVAGWQYAESLPPKDIIVLIADFDSTDSKKDEDGIMATIFDNLRRATEKYSDIKVQPLSKSITAREGREVARKEGEKSKATIVIWGWYRKPGNVLLSVNFEVLRPPKQLPVFEKIVRGEPQQPEIAELKSSVLQIRLAQEMSYLSLFTVGVARYAASDWDGAISRFSDALNQVAGHTSAPNQSSVYFFRASAYYYKDDYDHAITDYSRAIQLNPDDSSAYNNRGIIYTLRGNYDKGIADLNQAIKLRPNDAKTYRARASVYASKGDYNHTIIDINRAIQLQPNNAVNYHLRGIAYGYKQDFNQAIADFNQAIKLQPDNAAHYASRGDAYFLKHDYGLAIADLSQAIKLQPKEAYTYIQRGRVYFNKNDYDLAINDCNQALKLKPNDAEIYNLRGSAYYWKNNYDLAIADLNQAIKLQPKNAGYYIDRALAYRDKGDSRFLNDLSRAINLKPNNTRAYFSRGQYYIQKGDYENAINDFSQVIKLDTNGVVNTNAYILRGIAYTQKGDRELAIIDLKKALELTKDPEMRKIAGEELQKLGVK